jgi:hypothetical protein
MGGRDKEVVVGDGPTNQKYQGMGREIGLTSNAGAPILNQLSIFDTLRGLCGGDETADLSPFFGEVGRDQGGTERPKNGFERRFSLVAVGCANEVEAGTGGGGMRGS